MRAVRGTRTAGVKGVHPARRGWRSRFIGPHTRGRQQRTTTPPTKPALTAEEPARVLRLAGGPRARVAAGGGGPPSRKPGRPPRPRVLYPPADIEAWLESHAYQ